MSTDNIFRWNYITLETQLAVKPEVSKDIKREKRRNT